MQMQMNPRQRDVGGGGGQEQVFHLLLYANKNGLHMCMWGARYKNVITKLAALLFMAFLSLRFAFVCSKIYLPNLRPPF